MWHAPFSVSGRRVNLFHFQRNTRTFRPLFFCFEEKRIARTDSFVFMTSVIDDFHNFLVFFSLNSKNIGGVIPKAKSTKILSADDIVTHKKYDKNMTRCRNMTILDSTCIRRSPKAQAVTVAVLTASSCLRKAEAEGHNTHIGIILSWRQGLPGG